MGKLTILGIDKQLQRRLQASWRRKTAVLSSPVKIEFCQHIFRQCRDAIWYGGTVAIVTYKGYKFELCANGDVEAELLSRTEPVHLVSKVRDRSNLGDFYGCMKSYFNSDRALRVLQRGQHAKYKLVISTRNWWECFVTDPQGQNRDVFWALDSDNLLAALSEVLDGLAMNTARLQKEA